ncbi:MAG TPA: hypothetical protein VHZ24_13425 [Pirellulales bacterium]|jgi:hypothetical protein|nr:hypothetical protein [Pirellulales bacterium]
MLPRLWLIVALAVAALAAARPDNSEQRKIAERIAARDPRYLPAKHTVQTMRGWTVLIDDRLRRDDPQALDKALRLLDEQLKTIVDRVPASAVAKLRKVPLWMSPQYPGIGPKAEYHVSADWLREHGRDPAMAKGVEFTNVDIFEREVKRMPVFVLHELAHAYHDLVLGFDHPGIEAAYRHAVESKSYESVLRDGNRKDRAYAITNTHEYFAENTEAYFGMNDFYPTNRAELERHDPEMFRLLGRLWNVDPRAVPAAATR